MPLGRQSARSTLERLSRNCAKIAPLDCDNVFPRNSPVAPNTSVAVLLSDGAQARRPARKDLAAMAGCTLGFDPSDDIALGQDGCWRWNSDKNALHTLRSSFESSNEDGAAE